MLKLIELNIDLNNNTLLEKILELLYVKDLIYLFINFNKCNISNIVIIKLKIYK